MIIGSSLGYIHRIRNISFAVLFVRMVGHKILSIFSQVASSSFACKRPRGGTQVFDIMNTTVMRYQLYIQSER